MTRPPIKSGFASRPGDPDSILLAGQLPFKDWHGYIDNPMVADAVLDRMVNTSHRIQLSGESMRRLTSPAA